MVEFGLDHLLSIGAGSGGTLGLTWLWLQAEREKNKELVRVLEREREINEKKDTQLQELYERMVLKAEKVQEEIYRATNGTVIPMSKMIEAMYLGQENRHSRTIRPTKRK